MRHTQFFPVKPVPKGRPRMTRRGRAYTPQSTLEFERAIREQYDGPEFDGPVAVTVMLKPNGVLVTIEERAGTSSKLRGDVDNYAKAVLDALQPASSQKKVPQPETPVAFQNDKQVVLLTVAKA